MKELEINQHFPVQDGAFLLNQHWFDYTEIPSMKVVFEIDIVNLEILYQSPFAGKIAISKNDNSRIFTVFYARRIEIVDFLNYLESLNLCVKIYDIRFLTHLGDPLAEMGT